MAGDVLILGGLVFDDWSTPERMMFGGKQAMAVHKLPGGSRSVDTLGPDEMDISWTGTFWGDGAYQNALTLNGMRQSGNEIPLSFGGQFYMVVIIAAPIDIRRLPNYVTYSVNCLVSRNPMAGGQTGAFSSIDTLVSSDMATAFSVAGL